MHRRHFARLVALSGGLPLLPAALAHHGWSSFDQGRPIYLEGQAGKVMWRNPHVEFELEVPADLKLPADLATRALPAQRAAVDGPALLKAAQLPTRKDRRWLIELAPLTRMEAWNVTPLKTGDRVGVLGFTFAGEKGDAVLRVEYLFVGGKAYGLRSSPA
ncbi:MAG: hypothetical protein KIT17_15970 [Rubrivivax sp.]|nr:hypothetical protein [Rubrivivax sp.]